jgi:hypothetical protein
LLPLKDDDHMPPEGEPQPSAAEITLLEWWINAGGPAAVKVEEPMPQPAIQHAQEVVARRPEPARN